MVCHWAGQNQWYCKCLFSCLEYMFSLFGQKQSGGRSAPLHTWVSKMCLCLYVHLRVMCVCMHFWLCSSAILSMLSLSGMELVDLVTLGEQWANACCMLNNLEAYACVCVCVPRCVRACACLCVSIQTWLCIISMDWSWAELDKVKEHNDKENVCMRMLVCLSSRWQSF